MHAEIRIQSTAPRASAKAAQKHGLAHRIAASCAAALVSIAGFACFGASPEPEDPALSDPQLREARIEELRQAIAEDHAALEDLITRPGAEWNTALHEDPEMRAIAARLSEQEHTLERLEKAEAAEEAAR
jgi:hypothetical protein